MTVNAPVLPGRCGSCSLPVDYHPERRVWMDGDLLHPCLNVIPDTERPAVLVAIAAVTVAEDAAQEPRGECRRCGLVQALDAAGRLCAWCTRRLAGYPITVDELEQEEARP